ncbi:MAG: hypothetical protein ACI9WU_002221 [Myxococcota bacterium]|jgi:hypothetical protein
MLRSALPLLTAALLLSHCGTPPVVVEVAPPSPWETLEASARTDPAAAAVVLASRIEPAPQRDQALTQTAAALASTRAPLAKMAAERVTEGADRVRALLAAGALDASIKAARQLPSHQRWPHIKAAALAWPPQHLDKAVAAARTIPDPEFRAEALAQLGHTLAAEDRGPEASEVLHEATATANKMPPNARKGRVLLALAQTYARGGAARGALSLFSEATGLAAELPTPIKDPLLGEVIAACVTSDQLAPAMAAAQAIDGPEPRAAALAVMSSLCADVDCAQWILARAPEGAAGDPARIAAVESLARAGLPLEALKQAGLLGPAAQSAALRRTIGRTPMVPAEGAEKRAAASIAQRAATLRTAAHAAARAIGDPGKQAKALTRLAAVVGRSGDMAQGTTILNDAWQVAAGAADPASRMHRLLSIAEGAMAEGQSGIGRGALSQASQLLAKVPDALTRAGNASHIVAIYTLAKLPADGAKALPAAIAAASDLEIEGSRARTLLALSRLVEPMGKHCAPTLPVMAEAVKALQEPSRRGPIAAQLALPLAVAGHTEMAAQLVLGAPSPGPPLAVLAAHRARTSGVDAGLGMALRTTDPVARVHVVTAVAAMGSKPPGPSGLKVLSQLLAAP